MEDYTSIQVGAHRPIESVTSSAQDTTEVSSESKIGYTSNNREVQVKDSTHYESVAFKSEMDSLISDFGGDEKAAKQFLRDPQNSSDFLGAVKQKAQDLSERDKALTVRLNRSMSMPPLPALPKSSAVSQKNEIMGDIVAQEDSIEIGEDNTDLTKTSLPTSDDQKTELTKRPRSKSLPRKLATNTVRTGRRVTESLPNQITDRVENQRRRFITAPSQLARMPRRLVNTGINQTGRIMNAGINQVIKQNKTTSSISMKFEESLAANKDKKGLRLDSEQLEKFPGEIHDIVMQNRRDWKKGKTDSLQSFDTALGKTEIQYIAHSDTVIIRLGELGKGTYKTTSLAMDYDSGKLYASSKEAAHHESVSELMDDDTQYLSQFTNRGLTADTIVSNLLIPQHTYIANDDSKAELYQLSELCEGGELADYNASSFDLQEQTEITHDLLNCLKELHTAGIKHNDISGSNILMREKGKGASLMDFDESSEIMGGPKSQENAQKSDIKQLGVSLYQVFVGCSDEILETVEDDGMSQLDETSKREAALSNSENYSKLPEPKNEFEKLLLQMMHPKVDQRPTATEALEQLSALGI